MIDLQLIDKGESYRKLNKSYVIFICMGDIFGKGRHKYTFQNLCMEDKTIELGDEAVKIFLNTKGTQEDIDGKLKAVLNYIEGIRSEDPYVEELESAVQEAKQNREWRREYMTLAMKLNESYDEGLERGREEGMLLGREEGMLLGREEGMSLGREEGAKNMAAVLRDLGIAEEVIKTKLEEKFGLTEEEARKYL